MRVILSVMFAAVLAATQVYSADNSWYTGDKRCPPPKDDGKYSAAYDAKDHPHEYPTFNGADQSGWSCSYSREDGVIVQFGDSRTPQQQWMDLWGGGNYDN
ncbi:MAG: hypothetical protein H7X83_11000 [Verrucomicrobia bacterium]|nr:hypothetical protein [Deltaproteobacteria bacterium]